MENNLKTNRGNRYTFEDVKEFIEGELGNGCKLLSGTYSYSQKLEIECKCGEIFYTTFTKFKNRNKRQCNFCSKGHYLTYDYILDFVNNNSECKLISTEFVKIFDNLIFECKCGKEFTTSFAKFKNRNKRQCNDCGQIISNEKMSFNYDEIKYFIKISSKSNCKLLSEFYINCKTPLKIKCECGNSFKTSFDVFKFKFKRKCNQCTIQSTAEQVIEYWLNENNIYYTYQYRFPDCKNIHTLAFDFAIFDNIAKTKLKMIIKYDGEQHYKPARFSKDKNKMLQIFNRTKFNDNIKNNYCQENNIQLLRIPYWDFSRIEKILNKEV